VARGVHAFRCGTIAITYGRRAVDGPPNVPEGVHPAGDDLVDFVEEQHRRASGTGARLVGLLHGARRQLALCHVVVFDRTRRRRAVAGEIRRLIDRPCRHLGLAAVLARAADQQIAVDGGVPIGVARDAGPRAAIHRPALRGEAVHVQHGSDRSADGSAGAGMVVDPEDSTTARAGRLDAVGRSDRARVAGQGRAGGRGGSGGATAAEGGARGGRAATSESARGGRTTTREGRARASTASDGRGRRAPRSRACLRGGVARVEAARESATCAPRALRLAHDGAAGPRVPLVALVAHDGAGPAARHILDRRLDVLQTVGRERGTDLLAGRLDRPLRTPSEPLRRRLRRARALALDDRARGVHGLGRRTMGRCTGDLRLRWYTGTEDEDDAGEERFHRHGRARYQVWVLSTIATDRRERRDHLRGRESAAAGGGA